MAKAVWNGKTLAESDATKVVEGNHYFPRDSIVREHFVDSTHTSVCGWKGTANYYTVVVDGQTNDNAAWTYRAPKSAAAEITDYIAFWNGVEIVD